MVRGSSFNAGLGPLWPVGMRVSLSLMLMIEHGMISYENWAIRPSIGSRGFSTSRLCVFNLAVQFISGNQRVSNATFVVQSARAVTM